jgi:hypothetical protein
MGYSRYLRQGPPVGFKDGSREARSVTVECKDQAVIEGACRDREGCMRCMVVWADQTVKKPIFLQSPSECNMVGKMVEKN